MILKLKKIIKKIKIRFELNVLCFSYAQKGITYEDFTTERCKLYDELNELE